MAKSEDFAPAVWRARDWRRCAAGYLVTEPGDIGRPVALVEADNFEDDDHLVGGPLWIARLIAAEGPSAGWGRGVPVIDLAPYGRPDSTKPMPGFVYGLRCVPVPEQGGGEDEADGADTEPEEPRPLCRYMLADLADRLVERHFSDFHRRGKPYPRIGIFQFEDGSGAYLTVPIFPLPTVPVGPATLGKINKMAVHLGVSLDETVALMVMAAEAGEVWEPGREVLRSKEVSNG